MTSRLGSRMRIFNSAHTTDRTIMSEPVGMQYHEAFRLGRSALAQVALRNAQVSSGDRMFAGKAGGRLTEAAGAREAAVATPQAHRGRW